MGKNYLEDILGSVMKDLSSGVLENGKVYHQFVMHDDDCPMLNGGNSCNCDYELKGPIEDKDHDPDTENVKSPA